MRWLWGVDPSSRKLGVGLVNLETGAFLTAGAAFPPSPFIPRLGQIRAQTISFARALAQAFEPETIVVEQPLGSRGQHVVLPAYGVILEALHHAVDLAPWTVKPPSWKLKILGSGNAPQELMRVFAAERGYTATDDLDQLAGLGIAVFGALTWDRDFDVASLHPIHRPGGETP